MNNTITLSAIFSSCHKGAIIAGMDTVTIPDLTGGKANPQKGLIKKVMTGAVIMVNRDYENSRNNQLEAQGFARTFKQKARRWGTYAIAGLPIITNKDSVYLNTSILVAGKVSYLLNDKPIDKSEIIGLKESKGTGIPMAEVEAQLANMTDLEKAELESWQSLVTEAVNNPDSMPLDSELLAKIASNSKEVYPRDFKAESLQAIRVNKQEYINIDSQAV